MKFGTFHLYSVPESSNSYDVIHHHFEQQLAADRLGFHEVWLAEHNSRTYGFSGNTVVVASAIAAATERIRIATATVRLPLHHPVHLAEDLAWVDVLSKGRLDWGVGKGYDQSEFGTYGIDFDDRDELWQETFDAVRSMWDTGHLGWKSKHFDFAEGLLLPTPLQRPELPIYIMIAGSEASVLWAAERLLPIAIGSGPGWDDIRAKLELYAQTAEKFGHPRHRIEEVLNDTWQLRQIHVARTTERAIDEFRDGLMWYMDSIANRAMFGFAREHQPYEYYVEHGAVVLGSPQKVIEDLLAWNDKTGINNMICWFNIGGQPHYQVMNALERFSTEVMPVLSDVTTDPLRNIR